MYKGNAYYSKNIGIPLGMFILYYIVEAKLKPHQASTNLAAAAHFTLQAHADTVTLLARSSR
jgi:hypothetical protein